uniref:Uncharacterized protein n=1 Tax=Cucumis melo TaxID=3656 RepID=A0A9I9EBZ7_CUCME
RRLRRVHRAAEPTSTNPTRNPSRLQAVGFAPPSRRTRVASRSLPSFASLHSQLASRAATRPERVDPRSVAPLRSASPPRVRSPADSRLLPQPIHERRRAYDPKPDPRSRSAPSSRARASSRVHPQA